MDALKDRVADFVRNRVNYGCNVESLERKLRDLTARADDFEDMVRTAESSAKKKRKREVENWFKDVKKVKDDFIALQNRVEEPFWTHPLRGEHVVKMQERVDELIAQNFDVLVLDAHENRGVPRLTSRLFGEMFKDNLKKIWQCLLIDNIKSIGIYGMGGVGKTTLAKHINNHLLKITDFRVCWLTVSQELSIKKLQDDIARNLLLSLSENDDEETRAYILSRKLMEMNNFVIILDDVWEGFCLKKLGNPLRAGCRLILTTRLSQLCPKMDCQRIFEVKTLHTNEAWELFKDTLGYQTMLQADAEEVAKEVAKRCAGLPLGIITMAGSMKGVEDLHEWRNALEQLRALSVGLDDMERDVFPVLQWSFRRLNKCHQRCLLSCVLYPEDELISPDDIINSFISLDLMDMRHTRKQEYDQGHAILNKLINVCLLEKIFDTRKEAEVVKMHDLIRDMALRITSAQICGDMPRFMVKSGVGLTVIPCEREWEEDLHTVSLMNNLISEISPHTSPRCPNLSILILRGNHSMKYIPDSFFEFMPQLKVLDLSDTAIEELPHCISDMVNLTALILPVCGGITFVPPLRKLKNLRELDLWFTPINNIPEGLETLVNLKYLNCAYTNLRQIPEGTLSRFCYLQCLRMPCPIQIKELEGLKQLEIFEGCLLDDFDSCNKFFISHGARGWIDCYNIRLGVVEDFVDYLDDFREFNFDHRQLTFAEYNFGNTGRGGADVVLLPQNIRILSIHNCYGMGSCLADTMSLNSNSLFEFRIRNQREVEFLLRLSTLGDQVPHCSSLQALVKLRIMDLPNLVGLVRWDSGSLRNLPLGTFSCLRVFEIRFCEQITKLFPLRLLQNLQNLEIVKSLCMFQIRGDCSR